MFFHYDDDYDGEDGGDDVDHVVGDVVDHDEDDAGDEDDDDVGGRHLTENGWNHLLFTSSHCDLFLGLPISCAMCHLQSPLHTYKCPHRGLGGGVRKTSSSPMS